MKKVDYIAHNQSKCTTRELIKKCEMDLDRDIKGKKVDYIARNQSNCTTRDLIK